MAKQPTAITIQVPRLALAVFVVAVIGDTPLICHAWSDKAKKQMLDSQMRKGRQKKEPKDPERDFEESLYRMADGRCGFPATAFKSAMVSACRFADGVKMTELRGALHIEGDMIAIDGTPTLREDMVRLNGLKADIRYRGQFEQWRCTLRIQFNSNVISPDMIVNLLTLAGFGVGIGEWRPEKNGNFGHFHVEAAQEAS
jgi:hypothetical protein